MLVSIKVYPKSKKQLIKEENQLNLGLSLPVSYDHYLKVYLRAAPENNEANQELVDLLSKYYKVPKNKVKIIKGVHKRSKVVKIS